MSLPPGEKGQSSGMGESLDTIPDSSAPRMKGNGGFAISVSPEPNKKGWRGGNGIGVIGE